MEVDWNSILNVFGSTAIYSAVSSLVIGGGATLYKNWIFTEEEFRNRVNFARQRIIEKLAKDFSKMLHLILTSNIPLDSAPPGVVTDHEEALIKLVNLSQKLEKLYSKVIFSFGFLAFSIFLAVVGILIALPLDSARPYIAIFFYILIIFQGIIIFRIRKAREVLENYSQTI